MQLIAVAAACAALLVPSLAAAQDADDGDRRAGGTLRVYVDDDHIRVVTPSAGAQAPVGDFLLDVRMTADAVSGASIDVISEASPTAIDEHRLELGLGAAYEATPTLTLRSQLIGSTEADYDAITAALGADVSLAQRNTTVAVLAQLGFDSIGHAKRPEIDETKHTQSLGLSLTQVVDTRTYADFIVEGLRSDGYMESTYRTVPLLDPQTPVIMRVAEEVPDTRTGVAVLGRVRRAFGTRPVFAHLDYRFYADDWSVESHTASARLMTRAWRSSMVGVSTRGYWQTKAEFYRATYTLEDGGAPELRTREKRLGPMRSLLLSATMDMPIRPGRPRTPRVVIGVAGIRYWFPDFPAQGQRNAMTFTASVNAPF